MESVARTYEDFVPSSEFIKGEGSDTIVLELPGFKKEHLKVQLNNYGNLRIGGERPVHGNRWRRFLKDFQLPESCNASEIRAKFENGILTLTLPEHIISEEPAQVTTPPPKQVQEPQATPKPSEPEPEPAKTEKADDEKKVEEDVAKEDKREYGVGGLMVGMKMKRRQLINIAVAAVIMVGVGIYVAYYKFRKIQGAGSAGGLLEYL